MHGFCTPEALNAYPNNPEALLSKVIMKVRRRGFQACYG